MKLTDYIMKITYKIAFILIDENISKFYLVKMLTLFILWEIVIVFIRKN